ncbi:unnamed protein product [Prorocentrum cordatum]|uniref:Uncharacterized protein n=1 Tax=Prorocentrum cordatum TaxID=2364126 RepID=A0ABN9VVX3_9DINO|nr:unnamed protein product [Polarella glacialis]
MPGVASYGTTQWQLPGEAAEDARAGVLLGEENFVHAVLLEKRESTWLPRA